MTVSVPHAVLKALPAVVVVGGFSWIFFLPVSHDAILYPVFGVIGLTAVIAILRRNPIIDLRIWALILLIGLLGLYGLVRGGENPEPVFSIAIFLAGPALYLVCAAAATGPAIRHVMIAAVIGTLSVSVVLLLFVGGESGLIPQLVPDIVVRNLDLVATFRDGGTQARSWGLSSLVALGPLWVGSLFVGRHPILPPWWLRLVCALFAFATAIVADRTAIVLVMLLAPFFALGLRFTLFRARPVEVRHPVRVGIAAGGIGAVVIAALAVLPRVVTSGPVAGVYAAVGSFFGTVEATGDADQSIRSDQAWYLIQAWSQNPVFGFGFRAEVPGYARTSEAPWVLELQYHLLLFNVGLLGITLAIAALVVGFVMLRAAVVARPGYAPVLVAVTTGAVAMLVANATNPYLVVPGHQWAIFLPLAVATVALHEAMEPARDRQPSDSTVESRGDQRHAGEVAHVPESAGGPSAG